MWGGRNVRIVAKFCESLCVISSIGWADSLISLFVIRNERCYIRYSKWNFPVITPAASSLPFGVANEIHTPAHSYIHSTDSHCKTIESANRILWIFDFDMCPLCSAPWPHCAHTQPHRLYFLCLCVQCASECCSCSCSLSLPLLHDRLSALCFILDELKSQLYQL